MFQVNTLRSPLVSKSLSEFVTCSYLYVFDATHAQANDRKKEFVKDFEDDVV